jgi:ATP/maltotriose-dependent transcriptional regulator MalT
LDSLAAEGRALPAIPGFGSSTGLPEPLTDREQDVLAHLCRGGSNKAIARALHVSAETVKTHLAHIYGKLGAPGRREAVARARELGLVLPE